MRINAQGISNDGIINNMELIDTSGEIVPLNDIQQATHVKVDWSVQGIAAESNKDYTEQLPTAIKIDEKQEEKLLVAETEVGSYVVDKDNTLTIRFNKEIHQLPEASGTFTVKVAKTAEDTEADEQQQAGDSAVNQDETGSDEEQTEKNAVDAKEKENSDEKVNSEAEAEEPVKEEQQKTAEQASEKVAPLKAIEENILTRYEVTYETAETGEPIEKPGLGSVIAIKYWWELPNRHGYKEGDTYSFQVPPELDVYSEIDHAEMKFDGQTIGYLSVTKDGTATIEFTKFIEEYSKISGNFEIWTELSEETVMNEDKELVITPIEGKESMTIPIDFNPGGSAVEKKGNPNRSYNAEEIEWTVDFNKTLETIQNAKLIDPIQDGQALKEGLIKLYHLETKLNGEVTQGEEVDPNSYTIGKTAGGKDFAIYFKDDIRSAYRLVYVTDITNEDDDTFKNKATLTGESFDDVSADATVKVGRGKALEKKAAHYDRENQEITWEIRYNYNQKNIAQKAALLKDFFNGSQELVKDSFEVREITLNENGKEVGKGEVVTNYTVIPRQQNGKNGFHLQFNEDISSAYKIVYKTKASERVFDGEEIINTVNSGEHTDEGKQQIGQMILFKNYKDPNYKDKTVEWQISFNHDRQKMSNVVLEDVFTNKGLTLLKDEESGNFFRIQKEGGALEEGTDYIISKNEADQFVIQFKHPITEPHWINYTTTFDYDQLANKSEDFINQAHLSWDDANGESKDKSAKNKFTPDEYTKQNGFKNGSYNAVTKEITWNIGVNYNLKTLDNAVVKDFIQGNQQLLQDSITVHLMELTGGKNGTKKKEAVPGEDYSIEFMENEQGEPGFQIHFVKEINQPYLIEYKTSLKDLDLVAKNYHNTANLYNGNQQETELDASVSIPYGGKYTEKSGNQNGKMIDWKININFGQSQVSNATIDDKPSNNQALLEDSFRLYATSVDEAGKVTKGELLELNKDYTLDLEQNPETFTLKFTEEINEPYILEYQSMILEKPGKTVSNNISFNGENIDEVINESQDTVKVERTNGMGEGTGEIGRLTVHKTNRDTDDSLPGATFTLKDQESGITVGTKTTDEDGKVVFDRLLYGTYTLIEESAPDGYLIEQKQRGIVIDESYVEGSEVEVGNQLTVTNAKIIRDVQLNKIDKETGASLSGATFALQQKVGDAYKVIDRLTTNPAGIIYKGDLEPGEYQFVETKAPNGYELNTEPIPFTIGEKQTEIITLTAKNKKLASVELTKLAKEDGNRLAGAAFKLEREGGSVVEPLLRTDEDGRIFVTNLQPGTYQFVETKAPTYYQLNEEPISFTIKAGDSSTVTVTANNELIRGKAELTKVDKDDEATKLDGAVFELQNEAGKALQEDLTTDKAGKIVVENLKPGKYQFVETKAPEHYKLDTTPIPFTIEKSKTEADVRVVAVKATNELIRGSVELVKVDEDDEDKTLAGAVFELQNEAGETVKKDITTDENGKIVVENLRPGKYQFVETKAPAYYELDADPIAFEIEKSQKEQLDIIAKNKLITGKVELTKADQDNNYAPLAGAVFELQNEAGETLQEDLTTDKAGKIVVENLKPGKYQFVETKAPEHYKLDTTPIPFTIEKSKTKENVEVVVVKAENELIRGSVELVKVDEDDEDKTLAGAVFELQNEAGEMLQEDLTTDKAGKIVVENLKPGKYQFVETKAPAYYELDADPIAFEIEKSQKEQLRITAKNKLITGKVELTKANQDNNYAPLAGAVFELQNEAGETLQEDLTTDKAGNIVVENLKPGKYQFVEIKAPEHYKLDTTPIPFTIEKSKTEADVKVAAVKATNELIRGSVELVKVDEDDEDKTLAGAVFELQNEAGETLQEDLTTDKAGKIVVENLKPGNYQFVETKAPEHYELDAMPIPFTITFSQENSVQLKVENTIISEGPVTDPENNDNEPTQKNPDSSKDDPSKAGEEIGGTLPQTGEEWLRYMMILGVSLFIVGGFLIISRRRNA